MNTRMILDLKRNVSYLCILLFICLAMQYYTVIRVQAASDPNLAEYVQTAYNDENGFPASTATTVIQTSNGYIWFGTYSGLVRYDGKNFKLINNLTDKAFAGTSIRALFEDSQGRLWIGTNESGIICYANGEYTTFNKETGMPANSIRKIKEDSNGDIIVASTAGTIIINGKNEVERFPKPEIAKAFLSDMVYTEDGSFLGITDSEELFLYQNGGIQLSSVERKELSQYKFTCVTSSKNGAFYLGTSNKEIVELTFDGSSYSHVSRATGNLSVIKDIYQDSKGWIWVCADNGIGYFENNEFHEMNGVLMNNSVEEIYQDYEGSLWFVSSRQGVLQLSKSRFTNYSMSNGLEDMVVNSTAIYYNKTYIASDTGLVILDENGKQVTNKMTKMLSGIRIRCLLVDSSGYLWICTYQDKYGIIRYSDNGNYEYYNMDNGLASNKIRSAIEGKNGDILVVADNTISIISKGDVVKSYTKNQGLGEIPP